jgi:hypothetical protein
VNGYFRCSAWLGVPLLSGIHPLSNSGRIRKTSIHFRSHSRQNCVGIVSLPRQVLSDHHRIKVRLNSWFRPIRRNRCTCRVVRSDDCRPYVSLHEASVIGQVLSCSEIVTDLQIMESKRPSDHVFHASEAKMASISCRSCAAASNTSSFIQ